jgi:CubicO group peptidase (beta-lactamase class C family)
LKEVFFSPLGIANTCLPARGTTSTLKKEERFSHLARGYTYNMHYPVEPYAELKNYWPLEINQGDGGMISSAEDLIKWNNALYKGRVLPSEVLDLMLTKHVKIPGESDAPSDSYGYGLVCRESSIGDVYGHGGVIPGYRTRLEYVPSLNLTLVSFSNVTFDFSCLQEERDSIRKGLSHIEDSMENQREFDKIFKTRYPQVVELMEKHALPQLKDFGIID